MTKNKIDAEKPLLSVHNLLDVQLMGPTVEVVRVDGELKVVKIEPPPRTNLTTEYF